jgi:hypothetical protein
VEALVLCCAELVEDGRSVGHRGAVGCIVLVARHFFVIPFLLNSFLLFPSLSSPEGESS